MEQCILLLPRVSFDWKALLLQLQIIPAWGGVISKRKEVSFVPFQAAAAVSLQKTLLCPAVTQPLPSDC